MKRSFPVLVAIAATLAVLGGCATGGGAGAAGGVAELDVSDPVISSLSDERKENVKEAFQAAYDAAINREFDPGTATGPVSVWTNEVLIQRYEGGDASAAFVMEGPNAWYAHMVKSPILDTYLDDGLSIYGVPVSDEYPYGSAGVGQRFTKGEIVAEGGSTEFREDEWSAPEVPEDIGTIRSGDEVLSELSDERLSEITRAFRKAFEVAMARGEDLGVNSQQFPGVHQWDGPIVQNLEQGSSSSSGWGIPNSALMFMADAEKSRYAYFAHSRFVDKMTIGEGIGAHSGAHGYGGAISNQYRCGDGDICQAFGKGIMQLDPENGVVEFIPYF